MSMAMPSRRSAIVASQLDERFCGCTKHFSRWVSKTVNRLRYFATVAAGQTFELLGDVYEVQAVDLAAPCTPRLVLEPGDEILLVGRRVSPLHANSPLFGTIDPPWTKLSAIAGRPLHPSPSPNGGEGCARLARRSGALPRVG